MLIETYGQCLVLERARMHRCYQRYNYTLHEYILSFGISGRPRYVVFPHGRHLICSDFVSHCITLARRVSLGLISQGT